LKEEALVGMQEIIALVKLFLETFTTLSSAAVA